MARNEEESNSVLAVNWVVGEEDGWPEWVCGWLGGVLGPRGRAGWLAGWVEATRGVTGEATGGLELSWTLFYRVENACRSSIQI